MLRFAVGLTLTGLLLVWLAGCGASSRSPVITGPTGSLQMTVHRAATVTRVIPSTANCVEVAISNAAGWSTTAAVALTAGTTTAKLRIENIPVGLVHLVFTCYSGVNTSATGTVTAAGFPLGKAEQDASVSTGQATVVSTDLTLLDYFPLKSMGDERFMGKQGASGWQITEHRKVIQQISTSPLVIEMQDYDASSALIYDNQVQLDSVGQELISKSSPTYGTYSYAPPMLMHTMVASAPVSQTTNQTFTPTGGTPNPPQPIPQTFTWLGLEDVTTPAGTFAQCAKMHQHSVGVGGIDIYDDYFWFAPGVGKVKHQQDYTGSTGGTTTLTVEKLLYVQIRKTVYGTRP